MPSMFTMIIPMPRAVGAPIVSISDDRTEPDHPQHYTDFDHLLCSLTIANCATLARRELIARYYAEVRPEEHPEWMTDDAPMWLWFSVRSRIAFLPEITAVHRRLPDSVSHSTAYRRRIAFCDSLMEISLWFERHYGTGRNRFRILRRRSSVALWVLSWEGSVGEYLARWWSDVRDQDGNDLMPKLKAYVAENGYNLEPLGGIPACDLSCCFGFMHHVPSKDLRLAVIRTLIASTAPGGTVVLSFWRFMDDERLAAKARAATERARATGTAPVLDGNDYLLGWQDDASALRYCHHFTEDEISELAAGVAGCAQETERFSADGKSGALNRYLVLTRRG